MTVYGFIIMIILRRYMSTTYEVSQQTNRSSWIVFSGQLVEVRRNCFEQRGSLGIIIECACPNFGIGYDDDYWVYIEGELALVKTFQIYPIEISQGENLNEIPRKIQP